MFTFRRFVHLAITIMRWTKPPSTLLRITGISTSGVGPYLAVFGRSCFALAPPRIVLLREAEALQQQVSNRTHRPPHRSCAQRFTVFPAKGVDS